VVQLLALGGMSLALALAAAWFGGRVIGRPMLRVADTARRIALGELPRPTLIAADGEVWLVTRVFAKLHERLFEAASQLRSAESEIGALAKALDGSTGRYAAGGSDQASALNETSATTEELARSARQIAANAATVLDVSRQTLEAADSARAMADALSVAVERMKQDNASIAGAVELLGQRVQQVGQVVEFINGVADRTGLLALSADLEGTRAGDVGRGFILVAQEMRNLAENVLESTREIEELIGEVREATRSTQVATSRGTSFAERGLALAGDVTKSLDGVTQLTDETSAAVRTITLATQQQQTGTDQLAEAMTDILGVTQEELNTIKGLSAASERLQSLSKELSSALSRFRFDA
jgi:methyl-accepting chemotaxis protein